MDYSQDGKLRLKIRGATARGSMLEGASTPLIGHHEERKDPIAPKRSTQLGSEMVGSENASRGEDSNVSSTWKPVGGQTMKGCRHSGLQQNDRPQ